MVWSEEETDRQPQHEEQSDGRARLEDQDQPDDESVGGAEAGLLRGGRLRGRSCQR